jgi:plastocyanin
LARWLLVIALGVEVAATGCDAGAVDEPACDATTCAEHEGGSSPAVTPAVDAASDSAAPSAPPDSGAGPSATDGGDPVADAGDGSTTQAPEGSCERDDDCAQPDDLAACRRAACIDGTCRVVDDDDGVPEDDDNDCTEDSCNAGESRHLDEPPGAACAEDGGDYCDGDGACVECTLPSHCDSDVCQDGECRPAPCGNGELDTGETDVDCGGECGGCGPDQMCVDDDDCAGLDCTLEACVANCLDGVQNQGESDDDCGEVCPSTPCQDGDSCTTHADCDSAFCHPISGQCETPSCSDGVENGTESQIDCGGTTNGVVCPACPVACNDNWECDGVSAGGAGAGICYDGFCVDDVHGCTVANSADFLDMVTASQTAPITIDFGGALGSAYSPRCVKVTMGTKIRFVGAFASHPLRGGLADGTEQPASTGPFTTATNSGTSHDFVMDDCAAYPYFCDNHGLSGMTGAVIVLLP